MPKAHPQEFRADAVRISRHADSKMIRIPGQVVSVIVKRRGRSKITGPVVHDDLVQRQFQAASLDRAWFTESAAALLSSRASHQ